MQIKQGFSLIQALFILFIFSFTLLLLPNIMQRKSNFQFEIQYIRNLIFSQKILALSNKEERIILIENNQIFYADTSYNFTHGIHCGQHKIIFNQRGNINMGRTIRCSYHTMQKDIILNLGSGNIYVK